MPFSGEGLKEPIRSKEKLVTILRFIDKDLLPEINAFLSSLPEVNDINEHPMRTTEDGRYFLHIESSVHAFMREQDAALCGYLKKALTGLPILDSAYIGTLADHKHNANIALEKIVAIGDAASKRFDEFTEAVQGRMQPAEEEAEVEAGVREAGKRFNTPVDRLLRNR